MQPPFFDRWIKLKAARKTSASKQARAPAALFRALQVHLRDRGWKWLEHTRCLPSPAICSYGPVSTIESTNLEVVLAVDLNRARSARVLARHVPPRTVVPVAEDGARRSVEVEIGEAGYQIVSIEASGEMLIHQPRHRPLEIVPPVAEYQRHHRHLSAMKREGDV